MASNPIKFIFCSETINLRDTSFSLKQIWKQLVDNGNLNRKPFVAGDELSVAEVTNQETVKPIYSVFLNFLVTTRIFFKIKNDSN